MLMQQMEKNWQKKESVNDSKVKYTSCQIHKYLYCIKNRYWELELEGYIDNKKKTQREM